MITNAAINSTMLVANNVHASKYTMVPYTGTPLWDLTNNSYSLFMDNEAYINETKAEDIVSEIGKLSNTTGTDGICSHQVCLDKAVNVISNAVRMDMQRAKNVVKPIILSVLENVDEQMKDREVKLAAVLAIVPDKFEGIWSSSLLADLIEPFNEVSARSIDKSPAVHPMLSEEQILELLKSGSTRFDKEIYDWVNEIGRDFVIQTYYQYFLSPTIGSTTDTGLSVDALMDLNPTSRKKALLVHLMSSRLQKDPPEGINMDIGEYELMMSVVYSQTGRIINRIIEARNIAIRNKRMVIRWPVKNSEYMEAANDNTNIIVNEDVYDGWLEAGGTPEALLGAAVSDKEDDYNILLEKIAEYEKIWSNRRLLVAAQHESQRFTYLVRAINYGVSKEIADLSEDEVPLEARTVMHKALADRLSKTDTTDIANYACYVQDLVCDIMFADTNSKRILRQIDFVQKSNPSYTVKEAAAVTILDLIVEWVSTLIDVQKTN